MKKEGITYKDCLILSLLRHNNLNDDGTVSINKGRNKILYNIVTKLIGGEDKVEDYAKGLIERMKNSGMNVDDLIV